MLLWNIIEGKFFKTNYSRSFNNNIKSVPCDKITLGETIQFFKTRYVSSDGTTNAKFDSLKFRNNAEKEEVKKVLFGNENTESEQLKACFSIIYRLRCHLFHGVKNIIDLNDQNELFKKVNSFLFSCLQLSTN